MVERGTTYEALCDQMLSEDNRLSFRQQKVSNFILGDQIVGRLLEDATTTPDRPVTLRVFDGQTCTHQEEDFIIAGVETHPLGKAYKVTRPEEASDENHHMFVVTEGFAPGLRDQGEPAEIYLRSFSLLQSVDVNA